MFLILQVKLDAPKQGEPLGLNSVRQMSNVQQDIHGAIFDDSQFEDDDMIDQSEESPSTKQESASVLAFKSIIPLLLSRMISVGLFTLLPYSDVTFGAIAVIMLLTRHPAILILSIINFGPLRNTLGIYLENLPDHVSSFVDYLKDRTCFRGSSVDDQRRSFVSEESSDTASSSSDEVEKRASGDGLVSRIGNKTSPLIVGERMSAMSPSSTPDKTPTLVMAKRPDSSSLPAVLC